MLINMKRKGILISLEGGEGCGKSTQAVWLKKYLESKGFKVQIVVEPGETKVGNKIREILLDNKHKGMSAVAEVLLYMAARAQLVHEMILPALDKGEVIICDRYIDSSMAYQGYARGLGFEQVGKLNDLATREIRPDITFYFDLPPQVGLERKHKSTHGKMDRIENESLKFHDKVRRGYKLLAKMEPGRVKTIQADDVQEEIWNKVQGEMDNLLAHRKTRKKT